MGAYYLEDNKDLEWVPTNSANMLNVPNAIILNGTNGLLWPFMIGRAIYKGQHTLGKAHIGNNAFLLNFWSDEGEARYFDNFEVLACNPKPPNTLTTQRMPTTATVSLAPTTQELTTVAGQCDNALPVGECLLPRNERISCNGLYRTVFESSGNLVTYTTFDPIRVLWQTNTSGMGAKYACLQENGQIQVLDADEEPIWAPEWVDPDNPSLIDPVVVQDDEGQFTIDTIDGPQWTPGVDEDPPPIAPSPDPFIIPNVVPPNNPKNKSVILGPCGKLKTLL